MEVHVYKIDGAVNKYKDVVSFHFDKGKSFRIKEEGKDAVNYLADHIKHVEVD